MKKGRKEKSSKKLPEEKIDYEGNENDEIIEEGEEKDDQALLVSNNKKKKNSETHTNKSNTITIDLVNDNRALSQQLQENNIETSTKNQYKYKMNHFIDWVKLNHPHSHYVDTGAKTGEEDCVDFSLLTKEGVGDFLAHISKKKDSDGNYKNPIEFYSIAHVNGYVSALKNYYRKLNKSKMPPDLEEVCNNSLKGFTRKIENMKTTGEIPMHEGKMPMSFEAYRFIAKKTLEKAICDFPLFIFAHIFLLLCWNLIARCISVSSLTYHNISWEEDCMTVVFPTHKGDKEGKHAAPKHVYANPTQPYICPVLSFAIYIWCSGNKTAGATPVVFGTVDATEDRFSSWLRNFCVTNVTFLAEMGITIAEVGTHSFRKGIASFINGLPGGPSPVSIYIRAGWSLGKVVSRYILEGFGGDQLCGRAATGLSLNSVDFAMLPPHFDTTDSNPILTEEEWELYVPGYKTFYPEKFRRVFPYLMASLCYHKRYLDQVLHANHPLRQVNRPSKNIN